MKKFTVSYYIQERTLQVVSSRISEPVHNIVPVEQDSELYAGETREVVVMGC